MIPRLGTRVVVGVTALGIAGGCLVVAPGAALLFGAALAVWCVTEFLGAVSAASGPGGGLGARVLHSLLAAGTLAASYWWGAAGAGCGAVVSVLAVALWWMFAVPPSLPALHSLAVGVMCQVTVALALCHGALIYREREVGMARLLLVIAATVAGENGALAAGSVLGGWRPVPWLSERKTAWGFAAQMAASISVCVAAAWWLPRPVAGDGNTVAFGLLVGCAGVLGDLTESYIKRCLGVKDMASTIPATGGILDRVDGLLWAFPVAYWWWSLTDSTSTVSGSFRS